MSEQLLQQILDEIKGVKIEQQSTNQRLDRMEIGLQSANQRLDRMEIGLQSANQRLDRMEIGLQSTNQRLDRMEVGLQSTNQRLDRMEIEQQDLKTDILDIKKDTSLIPFIQQATAETNQNVLEVSATVERLENSQARHDKILESLSVRFFEHDTDLRELKRIK